VSVERLAADWTRYLLRRFLHVLVDNLCQTVLQVHHWHPHPGGVWLLLLARGRFKGKRVRLRTMVDSGSKTEIQCARRSVLWRFRHPRPLSGCQLLLIRVPTVQLSGHRCRWNVDRVRIWAPCKPASHHRALLRILSIVAAAADKVA